MTEEYRYVRPPWHIFQDYPPKPKKPKGRKLDETKGKDGIVLPSEGGVLVYWKEQKYPDKGFPFRDSMVAVMIVKRAILEMIRFLVNVRYLLILLLFLPNFILKKIAFSALKSFTFFTTRTFQYHLGYVYPCYFCKSGREIYRIGEIWANNEEDPEKKEIIRKLIMDICMIWEFETAYRGMGQDALGEWNTEQFKKNPVKEIIRTFDILIDRSKYVDEPIKKKWSDIKMVVIFFMRFKKGLFKELFEALEQLRVEEVKLDEGDIYHCLAKPYYNIQGKSYEKRMKIKKQIENE